MNSSFVAIIAAIIVAFIVGFMWGMGIERIIRDYRRRKHLLAIIRENAVPARAALKRPAARRVTWE
jgi:hypothetical protein